MTLLNLANNYSKNGGRRFYEKHDGSFYCMIPVGKTWLHLTVNSLFSKRSYLVIRKVTLHKHIDN